MALWIFSLFYNQSGIVVIQLKVTQFVLMFIFKFVL